MNEIEKALTRLDKFCQGKDISWVDQIHLRTMFTLVGEVPRSWEYVDSLKEGVKIRSLLGNFLSENQDLIPSISPIPQEHGNKRRKNLKRRREDTRLFHLEAVIEFLINHYQLNSQQEMYLREFISRANIDIHIKDTDVLYARTICRIDSEGGAVQFSTNLRQAMQAYLKWRNTAYERLYKLEESSSNHSVLCEDNLILLISLIFWFDRQLKAISTGGQLLESGEILPKI